MKNCFYDQFHVRYELVASHEGKPYNWLFLPGGPGLDSSYLQSLIDILKLDFFQNFKQIEHEDSKTLRSL